MSFTVENLEKNMAKLTITVSADDFEKALQESYMKIRIKSAFLVSEKVKYLVQ